jgi:uncharacterized protein
VSHQTIYRSLFVQARVALESSGVDMQARQQRSAILAYLAITVALSSIFWALIIARGHILGDGKLYMPCLMWCPGLAAFATYRVMRVDLRTMGLRWGGTRYALLGYFTPVAYATVAYSLIWILGVGFFPDADAIVGLTKTLGWTVTSPTQFLLMYLLRVGSVQVLAALTTALGEEIGWRGLLTPLMVQRFGFTKGSLFVGLIWAAWHMPILLFADYNAGTPWWFSIPCFCALTIGLSVIMSWFRLASASVWPCAILHASHNAFIQGYFTPLTKPAGAVTAYVMDEFGVALPLIVLLFATGFWLKRGRVSRPVPYLTTT